MIWNRVLLRRWLIWHLYLLEDFIIEVVVISLGVINTEIVWAFSLFNSENIVIGLGLGVIDTVIFWALGLFDSENIVFGFIRSGRQRENVTVVVFILILEWPLCSRLI